MVLVWIYITYIKHRLQQYLFLLFLQKNKPDNKISSQRNSNLRKLWEFKNKTVQAI